MPTPPHPAHDDARRSSSAGSPHLLRTAARTLSGLVVSTLVAAPATAQDDGVPPGPGWNAETVVELVSRARSVRLEQQVDTALQSYQSRANAWVYFYIDRPDEDERTLVKADQIALDVFWGTPDRTRQRIVGRRDQTALPTNVKYHLDHLTVVQDEFGDVIRLGDGDEVAAVPHPVGSSGPFVYDYRMADSLTISFGGVREPVRVYEVLVRPKDADRPGYVGSVFIDRDSAAIVRMSFTFTSSSYVDPYLDYIRISLDNAMWENRWWLPWRQELEVRREMPVIDFLAGSVIRGRFEVGDYQFNAGFGEEFFRGPSVTQVSADRLASFEFEDGLFDDIERRGLAPSETLAGIEEKVKQMAVRSALDGLAPLRLYWGSFSEGLRYDRSEGWVVGVGASFDPGDSRLRVLGARAFGAEEFQGFASLRRPLGEGSLRVIGRANRSRDLGPVTALPGAFNTISSLAGRDYTDLFRVSGGEVGWTGPISDVTLDVGLRAEDERPRTIVVDDPGSWRPLVDALPLRRVSFRASATRPFGAGGALRLSADVGAARPVDDAIEDFAVGGAEVRVDWETPNYETGLYVRSGVWAGARFGTVPVQDLAWMGGPGTVPGFDFRRDVGDRFVLARGLVGTTVSDPWLNVHAVGVLGWTGAPDPEGVPGAPHWPDLAIASGGFRAAVGAGAELFWRVLRLDVLRGLDGGDWELVITVRPDLADWM